MKLRILLRESARYIFRSKLLFLLMLFSFFLHYVGLNLVQQMTISVKGLVSTVGPREGMFVSIFLSLFVGFFLSAIYGIWMVPYFHQGERSQLTFVLPVSKWLFPIVYSGSLFVLVLMEFGIMLGSFSLVFGKEAILHPKFSWSALGTCLLLEVTAFQFLLFSFSVLSLVFGQMSTLFLGAMAFIILQVAGTVFRFGFDQSVFYQAYQLLPPLGELIFNLKQTFSQGEFPWGHFGLWILWLGASALLFKRVIRYPRRHQATQ